MEEEEQRPVKKRKVEDDGAKKKKGVCYLSRIPPHLKPTKLRHLLTQYGEVTRLYLVPEDPGSRRRRKRAGGNTGKNFTEGWVEFASKKDAKRIAAALNGQPMGGKRRSAYYYDLWNIKYLSKFKWDNLTEEIAYRNAVHEQKLATEISAAKRERDFYLAGVERSKAIKAMEEKQSKKKQSGADGDVATVEPKILRKYSQKKAIPESEAEQPASRLTNEVLAGVFARKAED